MIDNTSGPEDRDLFLALALAGTPTSDLIEQQEAAGQRQLAHSEKLPVTIITGTEEDFLALGFTFGRPDLKDPIFRPATLPDGWTIVSSASSSYWTTINDHLGRPRVSMFYKAAFYDRVAEMHLNEVSAYVSRMVLDNKPVISDDTWATPEAIACAARSWLERMSTYLSTAEGAQDTQLHDETVRYSQLLDTYGGAT